MTLEELAAAIAALTKTLGETQADLAALREDYGAVKQSLPDFTTLATKGDLAKIEGDIAMALDNGNEVSMGGENALLAWADIVLNKYYANDRPAVIADVQG